MDFFNWVSTGDNYKSSFQSSWSANAKRRKRQQAEAISAEDDRMARAAHAARAEAAEAAAAAVRARRGSWTGGGDGQRPGSARGGAARAKSGKKTSDGFDPVGQGVWEGVCCSPFELFVLLLPLAFTLYSDRYWNYLPGNRRMSWRAWGPRRGPPLRASLGGIWRIWKAST